jgi:ubiquinone/menaquinone biosynthesis C-methylase UbiE
MKVLDAGCSAGLYARTLLEHQSQLNVHALDFSAVFLQEAQRRGWRWQLSRLGDDVWQQPLTLVHADVRNLPYAAESFDMVVCGGSLNEFIDLPTCLAELARVLAPQGVMWQMYVRPADAPIDKLVQSTLKLTGIDIVEPAWLEQHLAEKGVVLERRETHGTIVFDLYRKRPPEPESEPATKQSWWFRRKRD